MPEKIMLNYGGIYAIQSPSGKMYIGSTVNFRRRKAEHFRQLRYGQHHSVKLQRAYNKYGADAMVFFPMVVCDRSNLHTVEQAVLDHYKPSYNTVLLAEAPSQDANVAARISNSNTGKKQSRLTIEKRLSARRGYRHTNETRQKISAAHQAKVWTAEALAKLPKLPILRGSDHPRYGKPLPDWHKKILSRAHSGKVMSQKSRLQISQTMKVRGVASGANNNMARAVECIDLNVRFDTIKGAVSWLREHEHPQAFQAKLRKACLSNGDVTVYGHKWRYVAKPDA